MLSSICKVFTVHSSQLFMCANVCQVASADDSSAQDFRSPPMTWSSLALAQTGRQWLALRTRTCRTWCTCCARRVHGMAYRSWSLGVELSCADSKLHGRRAATGVLQRPGRSTCHPDIRPATSPELEVVLQAVSAKALLGAAGGDGLAVALTNAALAASIGSNGSMSFNVG